MQSWADCITGTHESSFWKRHLPQGAYASQFWMTFITLTRRLAEFAAYAITPTYRYSLGRLVTRRRYAGSTR